MRASATRPNGFPRRVPRTRRSGLEAELALRRRLGGDEHNRLISQGNLAGTYLALGRLEEALQLQRDVYSENLKINGEDKIKPS